MSIVLGHRGASGYAPENTLEAFKLAMDMGADGFELDVHLSKDGELVVMHDETVDRTTDGTGFVGEMTLAELKALDASNHKEAYKGAKIPTLAEVYDLIRDTNHIVNVEIKTDNIFYPQLEEKRYGLAMCWGFDEVGSYGMTVYDFAQDGMRVLMDIQYADVVISDIDENGAVDAEELTERFVRGDASRNTEGSGLGLAIAKSLTEVQGGSFRIETDGDLFKVEVGFPKLTFVENEGGEQM